MPGFGPTETLQPQSIIQGILAFLCIPDIIIFTSCLYNFLKNVLGGINMWFFASYKTCAITKQTLENTLLAKVYFVESEATVGNGIPLLVPILLTDDMKIYELVPKIEYYLFQNCMELSVNCKTFPFQHGELFQQDTSYIVRFGSTEFNISGWEKAIHLLRIKQEFFFLATPSSQY